MRKIKELSEQHPKQHRPFDVCVICYYNTWGGEEFSSNNPHSKEPHKKREKERKVLK